MTRKELLERSKKEFEDKVQNALYWSYDRIYTKSGYCYIIKKDSKPLSCSFHFSQNIDSSGEIGKFTDIEFMLNTNTKLELNGIIEYKGFIVGILRQGNYNETMGMWHYSGNGSLNVIEDMFIITSEDEVNERLGVNAMENILKLQKQYPLIPSYFNPPSKQPYIMVDIEDSNFNVNSNLKQDLDGNLWQRKTDLIKLTFMNFTRDDAMRELKRIIDTSLTPDASFGILSTPKLQNKYFYQRAFNWKSLTYTAEFDINYVIDGKPREIPLQIKEVILENLQAI